MTGCRIGKVTYKNAPYLAEIIPEIRGADFVKTMHEHVDIISSYHPRGVAGFAVVAWGFDGQFSRGTRLHKDSFVGHTLLPSFVAEILRRDVAKDIAEDVVRGDI